MLQWGPPALWAAAIVAGSYLPSNDIPSAAVGQDIWIHLFMYAVLTALVYRWRRQLAWTAVACALFATVQEPLQGLSPTREASWDDWLSNLAGVALVVALLWLIRRVRSAAR